MDAYPLDYADHNLPFLLLSGLGATEEELRPPPPVHDALPGRATTSITSEISSVTDERAKQLLQEFLKADSSNAPWNNRRGQRADGLLGYKIRTVGRDFKLPPKKADSPSSSGSSPPLSPSIPNANSWILHSPISPLSPASTIYPDGVMTPAWIVKHQHYVPAVFLSFFPFTSDPNRSSINDNQLKTEINKIKAQIHKSEHRTRLAVVLLSDKTVLEAPDIDERLATIRRATGLDPKNSFFFLPPNTSQVEVRTFVNSILSALQPICIEYYRDLTKHARRKKGRGTVPPPTAPPTRGTSQTLSHPGWNVRYEFKLGVFAEFRQEMDAAQRHYNIALDLLFGSEGIFETTASWSPRWDEIRLLADNIALRHIRCQLWNGYPTSAAQTWVRYKNKMQDLLDRRGKGTSNYGWEAWESRWAEIMAQLIRRAELPIFKPLQIGSDAGNPVDAMDIPYSPPEKQIPVGEKLPPWELLHHPGYWYRLSAEHAKRRSFFARAIPEEDRTPPGMSPAAKVSNRNQMYDHYLVPEPHLEVPLPGNPGGFEHWKDIILKLHQAIVEFEDRGQLRMVEQMQLEVSRGALHVKKYEEAFKVLRPLWENMSWRGEGWWGLASEVLWGLHECALRVGDPETYIATEWELNSAVFAAKPKYKHDLMSCLSVFPQDDAAEGKHSVSLSTKEFVSCLSTSFTFSEGEGNVGEPLPTQISITSNARPGSAPITLSTLTFQFKGCLSEVQLSHEANDVEEKASRIYNCAFEEATNHPHKPRWSGLSDLTIHAGQTKVFNFPIIFREAGDVDAVTSSFEIATTRFDLVCSDTALTHERPTWWLESGSQIKARMLNRDSGIAIKVLPKPPKMEIRFPDIREQYYTDEPVSLDIEITNKEEEETEAVLEVRLLGRSKDTLGYSWVGHDASSPMKEAPPPLDGSDNVDLPGHLVGRLAQNAKTTERIVFTAPSDPSDYALEVKVIYHVLSDRDIPISKTMISDLIFNAPFEANYEFLPRVHPDPWPSYFKYQEAQETSSDADSNAFGLAQKWNLKAKVASFAEETLIIKDMALETRAVHGGTTSTTTKEFAATDSPINPEEITERSFSIDCRKLDLEERRPTSLDLILNITWQRPSPTTDTSTQDPPPIVTSTLAIPRLPIQSSEPRVLATAIPSPDVHSVLHIYYTLENPTMHFLTFELSMEASEEFGFSGPKLKILHLLPMSRQTVEYNLLPLVKGAWIEPQLRVVDRYFNKTLKVLPTEGFMLGADKKSVGLWVAED
ncbi:hypothetical protein BU24DRAFT_364136 [Aaosphaeria arxii CBS 175.79]|uniref:Uncharacterized protein n=1 Tax=Aaosphaeria arxii CBS 175.79 TaxID=1450172 RepID=A0A6A5Y0Q1_9PLEO|nr:uncharacterized protein BU24DRAFT_364136 [Aaosphaeria arxii CBS 175.79]KAF2018839.1 hypothetical protein BU24DRAFT_364136 [Aaosphaeria arxii CBS 175.79]